MAITKFIPVIWSETLYRALDNKYVAVKNCNRDFEGEIKNCGASVRICGVGPVTISDYSKNSDLSAPQTIQDKDLMLTVNRAKYFNFQIDDVDRAQAMPHLMDAAMQTAASALAEEADTYVFSLLKEVDPWIVSHTVTAENILDYLIEARTMLAIENVDPDDIVFEVHPRIAALLLKSKINLSTDNGEALDHGCIGKVLGSSVYVSNNVPQEAIEECIYHCFARTKRAVSYAEQLSEVEAYRPEKRFADAVKGLHLYGAKVMYPGEVVHMELGTSIVV